MSRRAFFWVVSVFYVLFMVGCIGMLSEIRDAQPPGRAILDFTPEPRP